MKYLTREGKKLLEHQIENAQKEIDRMAKLPPGRGKWTAANRYKDGLEYLLDMEEMWKGARCPR